MTFPLVALETLILRGEIMLSDLEHLLDHLYKQERITLSEHEALLELARTLSLKKPR